MKISELSANLQTAWQEAIRAHCGKGKQFSVADLAAASGVSAGSIYSIMEGDYSPSWPHAMAILSVLPKSAADMVLAPIGYTVAPQEGDACHFKVGGAIGQAIAHLNTALEDGRFDHRERAQWEPLLRKAQDTIASYLARNQEPLRGVKVVK